LETLHAIAAYTTEHGIATVYHPHGDTVIQYEDQIESLLDNTDAVQVGAFTTLDSGSVDLQAFRQVLDSVGYDGWAVVEQDMYPCPFDKPLPIARRNREFLRAISFG
jgi:sugar phosphate isomerase/epimerase